MEKGTRAEAATGPGTLLGTGSLPNQQQNNPNKFSIVSCSTHVWLEVFSGL